jgi:hypothetical protein
MESLHTFIAANRSELIRRCRAKVAVRPAPPPGAARSNPGLPLFLDQVVEELAGRPTQSGEIAVAAAAHGRNLLQQGFTVGQVVHDYGDVCQAVTDLAVERSARISPEDFRTLNRCLDDAIAGAVTQYTKGSVAATPGALPEIRELVKTAITAYEALQTGSVGVSGRTGTLVYVSLLNIDAILDRLRPTPAEPVTP